MYNSSRQITFNTWAAILIEFYALCVLSLYTIHTDNVLSGPGCFIKWQYFKSKIQLKTKYCTKWKVQTILDLEAHQSSYTTTTTDFTTSILSPPFTCVCGLMMFLLWCVANLANSKLMALFFPYLEQASATRRRWSRRINKNGLIFFLPFSKCNFHWDNSGYNTIKCNKIIKCIWS